MAKKLIRIEMADTVYNGVYRPSVSEGGLSFAFISPEIKERDGLRIRTQVSQFVTCREILVNIPYNYVHKEKYSNIFDGTKDIIDMNAVRLLIGTKADYKDKNYDEVKERLFSAKRAINLLEEYAGWSQSTITSVVHNKVKEGKLWLFTGDSHWIKSPQSLSLMTLIIRFAREFGKYNNENIDTFISSTMKTAEELPAYQDERDYIKHVFPHLKRFMKNFDLVFEGDLKQYYPEDKQKGMGGHGGIDSFFKKECGNAALNKRLCHHVFK